MTYDRLEDIPVYDSAEHLKSPEEVALYLEAAMEENDPKLLAHAIGVAARAQGMMKIAQETGRSREQLYRTLSDKGNPQLDTLMSVLRSLGLRLSVQPIAAEAEAVA